MSEKAKKIATRLLVIACLCAVVVMGILLIKKNNAPDNTNDPGQNGISVANVNKVFDSMGTNINAKSSAYLGVKKELPGGVTADNVKAYYNVVNAVLTLSETADFALNADKSGLYNTKVETGKTYTAVYEVSGQVSQYNYNFYYTIYNSGDVLIIEVDYTCQGTVYSDSAKQNVTMRNTQIARQIFNAKFNSNYEVTSASSITFMDTNITEAQLPYTVGHTYLIGGFALDFAGNAMTQLILDAYANAQADYYAGNLNYETWAQKVGTINDSSVTVGNLTYDISAISTSDTYYDKTGMSIDEIVKFNNAVNAIRMTSSESKLNKNTACKVTNQFNADPFAMAFVDTYNSSNNVAVKEDTASGKYYLIKPYINYSDAVEMVTKLSQRTWEHDTNGDGDAALGLLKYYLTKRGSYLYLGADCIYGSHNSKPLHISLYANYLDNEGNTVYTLSVETADAPQTVDFTYTDQTITIV